MDKLNASMPGVAKNMSAVWIIVAIIIVAAILGGMMYYFQTLSQEKFVAQEEAIEALRAELSEPAASTAVEEEEAVAGDQAKVEAIDELQYENDYYGFSLSFPETWRGYSVYHEANSIHFGFAAEKDLMAIEVMDLEDWKIMKKELDLPGHEADALYSAAYRGENDNFAFFGWAAQDTVNDEFILSRRMEVGSIIKTFKAK
ncbi:MAG: hypothetical protein PHW53_02655 [Patescibacteria group bacterium]|nr:hypothetical protein [Patescibacteria group bacterium]